MKLSVFLVLLPSVSAFVTPGASPFPSARTHFASTKRGAIAPRTRMAAQADGDNDAWSVSSIWRDVMGSASNTKAKVDSTAAEVYAELKKKVQVKQERQQLEGQLCSLIRIEGDHMSSKAEGCVRHLASELEALQDNAAAFGLQRTGLAGSWKLIYSSTCADGKCEKGSDRLKSIEEISYVSENFRLSHTDTGVLRVYKRVSSPIKRPAAAAAAAAVSGAKEDDTAHAAGVVTSAGGVPKMGRASATAAGRAVRKQPLRKRMFFGWRRG